MLCENFKEKNGNSILSKLPKISILPKIPCSVLGVKQFGKNNLQEFIFKATILVLSCSNLKKITKKNFKHQHFPLGI